MVSNLDKDYAQAGFGQSLTAGARPALIIIDFGVAYLDPQSPFYAGVEDALLSTGCILSTARAAGIPVIHTNVAPSNIYQCKDGEIIVAANQDTVLACLCDAMERPDLVTDKAYASHTARAANQEELDNIIDAWTQNFTMDEVEAKMEQYGVSCRKVCRAPEMPNDPHFEAREAIVDVDHPTWESLKMQNVFPKFSATPGKVRWAGPELGGHTREVYGSLLGLSSDDMDKLEERGVI